MVLTDRNMIREYKVNRGSKERTTRGQKEYYNRGYYYDEKAYRQSLKN